MLFAQALLSVLGVASEALALILTATLLTGIWSLDGRGRWFRLGCGLGLAVLLALLMHLLAPNLRLFVLAFAGQIGLSVLGVVLGVRWLFATARITVQTLLSAVSVYLLIGVTFGLVYVAVYHVAPSAFGGVSPAGRSAETAELLYYSLGCLSSSAFGDILPTHPLTRLLANTESVLGQLYMAVLVAILITGYVSPARRPD
jgi:hypothetical protein